MYFIYIHRCNKFLPLFVKASSTVEEIWKFINENFKTFTLKYPECYEEESIYNVVLKDEIIETCEDKKDENENEKDEDDEDDEDEDNEDDEDDEDNEDDDHPEWTTEKINKLITEINNNSGIIFAIDDESFVTLNYEEANTSEYCCKSSMMIIRCDDGMGKLVQEVIDKHGFYL
jgi:hypothetical protein